MTQEWVDISIRAPEHIAKFARFAGNDACILILEAHVLLVRAEESAGADDAACWDALVEREYLLGCVSELVDWKLTIHHEANQINGALP